MKVMPSVLTNSPQEFSLQINRLSKYFSYFQIDIADGHFVPNVTTQIDDILNIFGRCREEKVLPARRSGDIRRLSSTGGNEFETESAKIFDFHLMVNDYEKEIEKLLPLSQIIKINIILIHHTRHPDLEKLAQKYPQFSFAPVFDPQDEIDDIKKCYDTKTLKYLQIMTVNPGFQGSPFIEQTLKKIEHLRLADYRAKIYIDGAVNDRSIPILMNLKYPPDFVCPGSFLSKAENLEERINYLNKNKLTIV